VKKVPDRNQNRDKSKALGEAKEGTIQLGWGLFSLFASALAIGFILWFMHYGTGHIRVPIVAIIVCLGLGVLAFINGLRKLIWAFRGPGIIVATLIGFALAAAAVWYWDDSTYKTVLNNATSTYSYDGVERYVAEHSWSPHAAELDDAIWNDVITQNYAPPRVRWYQSIYPKAGRHTAELEHLKTSTLSELRRSPSINNALWYNACFLKYDDKAMSAEMKNIMLKAIENADPLHPLTPPLSVLNQFIKERDKVTYSMVNNSPSQTGDYSCAKDTVENVMREFVGGFPVTREEAKEKANIRFDFQWRPGNGFTVIDDQKVPSQILKVTISIYSDSSSSPIWTADKEYESPENMYRYTDKNRRKGMGSSCFETEKGLPAQIESLTLLQFRNDIPMIYWNQSEDDFVYKAPEK
jgi:hypothetical protein